MTDNNRNTQQHPQHNDKKTAEPKQTAQPATTANAQPTAPKAAKANNGTPQMKKVSIAIAGVTYSVYCPVNEEADLRSAVYYINNFALDIKKESPNLNQENLLLLSCLNLYEKIHAYEKADNTQREESKKANELLSKIVRDAKTVL